MQELADSKAVRCLGGAQQQFRLYNDITGEEVSVGFDDPNLRFTEDGRAWVTLNGEKKWSRDLFKRRLFWDDVSKHWLVINGDDVEFYVDFARRYHSCPWEVQIEGGSTIKFRAFVFQRPNQG